MGHLYHGYVSLPDGKTCNTQLVLQDQQDEAAICQTQPPSASETSRAVAVEPWNRWTLDHASGPLPRPTHTWSVNDIPMGNWLKSCQKITSAVDIDGGWLGLRMGRHQGGMGAATASSGSGATDTLEKLIQAQMAVLGGTIWLWLTVCHGTIHHF